MRIFVAGANGRIGRCVVQRALAEGHRVTAFVRDPGYLRARSNLSVYNGRVAEDRDAVCRAVAGHDAIVSAVGNPLWLKGGNGPAIVEASFRNLVAGAERHGVERFVAPLAWGTGASRQPAGAIVRFLAATLIRRDFRDFDAAEAHLAESRLVWTIAYFGALTDGEPTRDWSVRPLRSAPARLRIAREDVAAFLVAAATRDTPYLSRVVLSGGRER